MMAGFIVLCGYFNNDVLGHVHFKVLEDTITF